MLTKSSRSCLQQLCSLVSKVAARQLLKATAKHSTSAHEGYIRRSNKGRGRERSENDRFCDACKVLCVGGDGGYGLSSFDRVKNEEFAGADGGNGGAGGHIIVQADGAVTDLQNVKSFYRAAAGQPGGQKGCYGRSAEHLLVRVPVGTLIRRLEEAGDRLLGELNQPNGQFLAARGGDGGRGNYYFISNENKAPRCSEAGGLGERVAYRLQLKLLADAGLVGFPNAGKSTFLRAISRAAPKVAPYAFTTLRPHVGVVTYRDFERITVADIPGIVDGSHRNEGLGLEFLRHIERCHCLIFVLDASEPDDRTLSNQLNLLCSELDSYKQGLSSRPKLLLANKMDLAGTEDRVKRFENSGNRVFRVSALTHQVSEIFFEELRLTCDRALQQRSGATTTVQTHNPL